MASLGSLVIELAANSARLSSDMGKAVGIVERGAQNMQRAFKFIGGGLLGGALISAVKDAAEFGDTLNKAAIKAGVSGNAISELAYAAKLADVDLVGLSNSLKFMQVNLSKAASGAQEPIEALSALGLSIKDIKALAPDKQFELLADRISQLKDPADRARAAVALFGKAGSDLLPLFNDGAKGIQAAREEAIKLGQSFSTEQLQAIEAANDSVTKLTTSFTGFAVTLVSKVAPGLTQLLDNLRAVASGDAIGKLREQIDFLERMKGRSFVAAGYGDIGTGFFTASEGAAKLIELQAKLDAKLAASASRAATKSGTALGFLPDPKKVKDSSKALEDLTKNFDGGRLRDFNSIVPIDPESLERSGRMFTDRFGDVEDSIKNSMANVTEAIKDNTSEWSVYADQAARNMQTAFADFLFDPFQDGLKGMLKGFLDVIRRMVAEQAAAKIFGSKSSGGLGIGDLVGKGIGKLFGFADGGSFKVGGSGGTDSQLVAFRASPNETVSINKPGQGGGGVTIVNNVDARGNSDLVQVLPAILAQNSKQTVDQVRDLVRRGKL